MKAWRTNEEITQEEAMGIMLGDFDKTKELIHMGCELGLIG